MLTALGQFLLSSGRVRFILHVGASRSAPMRSERRLSFDAASVLEGAGSRYGPAAPLADFSEILDRGEPFALIAKPCDITAVRNLARLDPRVDDLMRYALAFVCGGASDLSKSEQVLQRFGSREDELALFRYRGHGNPGPNSDRDQGWPRLRAHLPPYVGRRGPVDDPAALQDLSRRDRSVADIVASDAWLNGGSGGRRRRLNGIFVRTRRGLELYDAAVAAGAIAIKRDPALPIRILQSHQVRKRRAVWARLKGMADRTASRFPW